MSKSLLLVLAMLLGGCGDDREPVTTADENVADTAVAMGDTAETAVTDAVEDASGESVPTNGASLLPWLQARSYSGFPKETKVHASSGVSCSQRDRSAGPALATNHSSRRVAG